MHACTSAVLLLFGWIAGCSYTVHTYMLCMHVVRVAAADASRTGAPVMRPMFYDFWLQPTALNVDDQMMFGPDYLVAPQLHQGASSRTVWLPQLPSDFVWRNVFTRVATNTSAAPGGVNVTEATPTAGENFSTFPLYFREPVARPPPPPGPAAPCDDSCTITPHLDAVSHRLLRSNATESDADCCAQCKAYSDCEAFVRGPDPHTKVGRSVRRSEGRKFGGGVATLVVVRSNHPSATQRTS